MTDFFYGVIATIVVTWAFFKWLLPRDSLVNPDMEEVKERIERAEELRSRLEKIDNMITDFEVTTNPEMCVSKNLRLIYGGKGGLETEVQILMQGDYTTKMLLEMLTAERSRIANELLDETERIPKRHKATIKDNNFLN